MCLLNTDWQTNQYWWLAILLTRYLTGSLIPVTPNHHIMESEPSEAVILLVEDNPGDVRLIEEAFSDGDIANTLHSVTDGQAALDFIYQCEEYGDAPRPDIVLLDLKLPKVDGEDVLHEIKYHPELNDVPVIVLSGLDDDLIEARDLDHDADEDAILEKPVDPGEFVEIIRSFEQFRLAVMRDD